jgi:hypothetical protein
VPAQRKRRGGEEEEEQQQQQSLCMLFTGVFDQMCESNFQAELFSNDFLKFST